MTAQDAVMADLVAASPAMMAILRRLEVVARVGRTTLIAGPTGSGKDVIARSLHLRSARCNQAFVPVQCAALPEMLVEAELFGHVKGAFTGALQERDGLVRTAGRGTLFLDEVDSLSLSAQAKLLRFLETGEFRPVGSDQSQRSNAWLIAATNQDLRARVDSGIFREDLLYRLEVMRVDVPALRDREADIMPLVQHFLEVIGCGHKRLTQCAIAALHAHSWPGNVRELRHRLESAALVDEHDKIDAESLGLCSSSPQPPIPSRLQTGLEVELWRLVQEHGMSLGQATAMCEAILLQTALRLDGHNRKRAAVRLGINVRTMYKKLPRSADLI